MVRLTNGFVDYFRDKDSKKYICKEVTKVGANDMITFTIFRSFLFRHIIGAYRVLDKKHDSLSKYWLKMCPMLRAMIVDNFQAMCKFEDLEIPYDWSFDYGGELFYNVFNQFYVLYCGY